MAMTISNALILTITGRHKKHSSGERRSSLSSSSEKKREREKEEDRKRRRERDDRDSKDRKKFRVDRRDEVREMEYKVIFGVQMSHSVVLEVDHCIT